MATLGNVLGHAAAFYLVSHLVLQIPRCAVSVILLVEFAPLLRSLPKEVVHLYRQARRSRTPQSSWLILVVASDLGIYLVAFLSPLLFGIVSGSIYAILFQLVSTLRFAGPGYVEMGRVPGTSRYDELEAGAVVLEKIVITRPMGPRWFGNAAANSRVARQERRKLDREVLVAIVDWRMVPFLDETAIAHYKELVWM